MAQRRIEDRLIRKLYSTGRGRSVSITLPIEIVRELNWRRGQKVVVNKHKDGIIIRDWNPKR